MNNQWYVITLPNKEPRIIENIVYDKVRITVENLGGTLVPYVEPKQEPPVAPAVPKTIFTVSDEQKETISYSWSEVVTIYNEIKAKYFPNVVVNSFTCNRRIKCLGREIHKRLNGYDVANSCRIELNPKLMTTMSRYLHQVIYHELCHAEFLGEGHTGYSFRNKEYRNPYRIKQGVRRLTCVS